MLYITLLDQFHPGIYSSQVIDVCDYLNRKHNAQIRVLAFLSIRELKHAKPKLKALSPTAIVLPAFPGLKNFQLTSVFLFWICLFTGERIAICRNVFCTKMALRVRRWGLLKKVVFDGRSAMSAEIGEYDVFPVDYLRNNVASFEKFVVNNSDFRMAVSSQLVEYWKKHYQYNQSKHVIIPCTLDTKFFEQAEFKFSENTLQLKKEMGFLDEDIILVYAGSTAPWQSFTLLEKILSPLLETDKRIKVLFLSKENDDNKRLQKKYPGRIVIKWVEHAQVLPHLHCADYGILLRSQSLTNLVASPTKFAEYLAAGLKILITDNLGDFSEFVKEHHCGLVLSESEKEWPEIRQTSMEERRIAFGLSKQYFRKEAMVNSQSYTKLMTFLKE